MKKIKFQILLLMCLLAGTLSAQTPEPKVVKKVRGDKATIMVDVQDRTDITRLRLVNEETNEPIFEDVPDDDDDKTVLFEVEVAKGKNNFNLFGYNKNKKVVYFSIDPIVLEGKEDKPESDVTKNTVKEQKSRKVSEPVKETTDEEDDEANKVGVFVLSTEGATATLNIKANDTSYVGCENVQSGKDKFENCEYKIKVVGKNKKSRESREPIKIKYEDTSKVGKPELPQSVVVELYDGNNTVTVWVVSKKNENGKNIDVKEDIVATTKIECKECEESPKGLNYRALVGFQQVGASSAESKQFPYLNFQFSTPIRVLSGRTISAWGDVNFQPTAIQTLANLSNFATTVIGTEKPNNLVQSFDFLVGLEFDLIPRTKFFGGSFNTDTSLSFIVSGGATLPLSTSNTPTFYKIPKVGNPAQTDPAFLAVFPGTENKDNIAFVAPERDRFFRQYYAGVRLKTYFDNKNMYPANFDLMLGQNEAITNKLRGTILRLDGSTPLPIRGADFLYIFGGAQMKLTKKFNDRIPSFFLEPATNISLTNAGTFVAPIDKSPFLLSDRDTFRLGIGIDLFRIFKKQGETSTTTDKK